MKTDVMTPQTVFLMPQYLEVPAYQRPYVWTKDEQWEPLWADLKRVAEHRLSAAGAGATHFLGAVVVQQAEPAPGRPQQFNLVDGQQRLTTLQLVLDAAGEVLASRGLERESEQLGDLTHNQARYVASDRSALKLQHSNRDRDAFVEVMDADAPIDYAGLANTKSLLVKAHQFFAERIGQWLDEAADAAGRYGSALADSLQNALQIVVIRLEATEDSQEIFETLNARGTPLTAADLIKNFVFQRLRQEGVTVEDVHARAWPFATEYWEEEVSVGRSITTRGALFLSHWLVSRTGQEVSPRSTFSRFKFYAEHESGLPMLELMATIAAQADDYRALALRAAAPDGQLDRLELHMHRMSVVSTEITKPIVIWLREPASAYPESVLARVIDSVESWVIRRRLLRLASSDQGRIAATLIGTLRGTTADALAGAVDRLLASQDSQSTYWPGDDEVRDALRTAAFYRRYPLPFQRIALQAVEDWYRGFREGMRSKTGVRVGRDRRQQVEHVLPRSWERNWAVEGDAARADRDAHVDRLGNLTLLTGSLNAAVSNAAWSDPGGKRAALERHDVFLLNRRVREHGAAEWDETAIDERTSELTEILLQTWPVPPGHKGSVSERRSGRRITGVSYADITDAGLLPVGSTLTCTDPRWPGAHCTVLPAGRVRYDGSEFSTPAAAARVIRQGSGNAWWFWRLENGPMLHELRAQYLEAADRERAAPGN